MKAFPVPSAKTHPTSSFIDSLKSQAKKLLFVGSLLTVTAPLSASIENLYMDTVEILRTDIIDSDATEPGDDTDPNWPYTRDQIHVQLSYRAKGTPPSIYIRPRETVYAIFQILDEDDHQIYFPDKVTEWSVPLTATYSTATDGFVNSETLMIPFYSGYTFSPENRYRVSVRIETVASAVVSNTEESAEAQLFHYKGDYNDPDFNTILSITSAEWVNRIQLNFEETPQSFSFRLTGEIRRYDSNDIARTLGNIEYELYRYVDGANDERIATAESVYSIPESIEPYREYINIIWGGRVKYPIAPVTIDETVEFDVSSATIYQGSEYYVVARLHCRNSANDTSVYKDSQDVRTTEQRLLRMNGKLYFGGIETDLSSLVSTSILGAFGSTASAEIIIGDAEISGMSGFSFSTSGSPVPVMITVGPDGSAYYMENARTITLDQETLEGTVNGVDFERGAAVLSKDGVSIENLTVYLPAGMGCYKYDPTSGDPLPNWLSSVIRFKPADGTIYLTQTLYPDSDLVYYGETGNRDIKLAVSEESRPLIYVTDYLTWKIEEGRFIIHDDTYSEKFSIHYAREAYDRELFNLTREELNTFAGIPFDHDINAVEKPSNDHFYRYVNSLTNDLLYVSPAPVAKHAVLSGSLKIQESVLSYEDGDPVEIHGYTTHFPQATYLDWSEGGGHLNISGDQIVDSFIVGVAPISIPYSDLCSSAECPVTFDPLTGPYIHLVPDGYQLDFTTDGGLYTSGVAEARNPDGDKKVKWGYHKRDGKEVWAQSTDAIDNGHFVVAGTHYVKPIIHSLLQTHHGASVIMLSGVNPDSGLTKLDRPPISNDAYNQGLGYYAGFNYWGKDQNSGGSFYGHSVLTGTEVDFMPSPRIKYYLRYGGVSGIHEALEPPSPLEVSGYKFDLTGYKFSFLDSKNHQSLTEGSLAIPEPIGITLEFEEMTVSCVGDLGEAKIVEEGDGLKDLVYWNGQIKPISMQFAKGGGCPTDGDGNDCNLLLSVGVQSWIAHIPTPISGFLGMRPDGNLQTAQHELDLGECITGINSRFTLPATFKFSGPGNETYTVVPVNQGYYNNPEADAGEPDVGNFSFAGTMGVPLFDDLEVHVCTSARTKEDADSDAIVHIQGGWKDSDSGLTFFDSTIFDLNHASHPPGTTQEDYHNTTTEKYLTRAKHNWLDVVPFDYPIVWDEITRSFKSLEPVNNDLLVLNIDHEIKYLSANSAELKFGAVYQGIPEVNLAQFTFDRIDGPLESLESAITNAGDKIAGEMLVGIDSAADLVSDRLEDLVEELFVEIVDPLIDGADGFYNALLDRYIAAPSQWTVGTGSFESVLDGYLTDNVDSIQSRLYQLTEDVSGGLGLLEQIDNKLARAQNAIRAVAGQVMFDSEQGGDLIPYPDDYSGTKWARAGFLYKANPGDAYQYLQNFVQYLLEQLSQDLADNLADALGGALDDLNAEINTLLEDYEPTINEIVAVLNRLDGTIGEVRGKLGEAEALALQLQAIVNSSTAEIDDILVDVRNELNSYFLTMSVSRPEFGQMNPEEVKQRIRSAIKDRFTGTVLLDDIKVVLKQQVYDLQALLKAGVDNVFAQVNEVLMDLVESVVAELDDEINGFLDDLANVVGGGQIQGYASIHDDALRYLRLDLDLELKLPDDFTFHGYLEIEQMNSMGDTGCDFGGDDATEVRLGATDVGVGWISPDLRMDIEAKFSFNTDPGFQLRGMGAGFEMTGGELSFEGFAITEFGAGLAFGLDENYIAAKCGMRFSSYEVNGGFFFGRTCFIDPIEMIDPEVAEVIGTPPFTGGYVFGGCYIPVSEAVLGIPASCFFEIGASVETGVFYFIEGPTYGGKIGGSVSGEAICLVSIKGEMMMIGVKKGDNFTMQGKGKVKGKVGSCPFCIKFSKGFKATYQSKDDSWDLDM